ncbi:MAG: hypothetical protein E7148_05945 [Rikenellaceae bacterium]|nr:hypothetical protein [Rikenellaceae bacterium]
MTALRYILLVFSLLVGIRPIFAQYYTWGADAPTKWSEIRDPKVRVIYPDSADALGRRTLHYIQSVQPDISYGFSRPAMQIPFVLHTENFQSNGMVMYMPKRVDFLTTPSEESYSMPWIKQLVAHEYRHAVQYNNLNQGILRILRYLLGQQGATLGMLFMPSWAMEGDAVMSETMMSSFGRGLQPSFSMGYRAIGRVGTDHRGRDRKNTDRWFCGSFRDYIPNHYELGYQICSYAYDRYGENIWDKVTRYGARNPYVFATTRIALKKYYDTSVNQLFRETFDALKLHWDSIPTPANSSTPLVELDARNYTTYQWPIPLDEQTVLVLKSDFDRTNRFVRVDLRSGKETTVAYTGVLSSRPVLDNDRIWWTEYRRSKLFEERVNSQLCYMNLADGKPRQINGERNSLYPTPAGDKLYWVTYHPNGRYSIMVKHVEEVQQVLILPADKEIHGLAWDNQTAALYGIITDDNGMWLARIDSQKLHPLTTEAYITLSDLRAANGWLYYGSIASGRDEVHGYDLSKQREYRLTTSTYGSFDGIPSQKGDELLLTTYEKQGYRLARQPLTDTSLITVKNSRLPINLVNPPRKHWEVINLDIVNFTPSDLQKQQANTPSKRYRHGLHLFNVHSWMPVSLDIFNAIDEHQIDTNVGVTLLSQNQLSNTEAYVTYGWHQNEGSLFKMGVRYFGLGVHLNFDVSYGGNQIIYSPWIYNPATSTLSRLNPRPEKYYSIGLSTLLPLYFQRGYHTRILSASVGWNYSNGLIANLSNAVWYNGLNINPQLGFKKGLHKLSFGASFTDQIRMAHRDFAPRWGYGLKASYTINPANRQYSDLVSLYGEGYLPGIFRHHSLKLATNYQTSIGGYQYPAGYSLLGYRSAQLIPRGFSSSDIEADNYFAISGNYQFPLCYPEGGIPSVLYIKRIRLNIGGDYARFDIGPFGSQSLWAVGGDLIFDFNVLRLPAKGTSTFKLSIYKPSIGDWWISGSIGLPF